MKLLVFALLLAALCYAPAIADDEAEAEAEADEGEAELEAEIENELGGEEGISAAVVELPTIPQGIDNGIPWECIPGMWYNNSCQFCKCRRNRQLRCIRRRCN